MSMSLDIPSVGGCWAAVTCTYRDSEVDLTGWRTGGCSKTLIERLAKRVSVIILKFWKAGFSLLLNVATQSAKVIVDLFPETSLIALRSILEAMSATVTTSLSNVSVRGPKTSSIISVCESCPSSQPSPKDGCHRDYPKHFPWLRMPRE